VGRGGGNECKKKKKEQTNHETQLPMCFNEKTKMVFKI
jgi:hypothetical protein